MRHLDPHTDHSSLSIRPMRVLVCGPVWWVGLVVRRLIHGLHPTHHLPTATGGVPRGALRWSLVSRGIVHIVVLTCCSLPGFAVAQSTASLPTWRASASPFGNPARAPEPAELRLNLSQRTLLVVEPAGLQPASAWAHGQPLEPPRSKVGLEFKAAPRDGGARSLLRVQLDGGSTLNLRPRGGGVVVSYRSEF